MTRALESKYIQTPAVVVGMENNGLGVARALARDKIPVIGLAGPHWSPSCVTNTCKVIRNGAWTSDGVKHDLISIGKKLNQKVPLLITKDEPVLWISESRKTLEEYYNINLPENNIIDLLMSKKNFHDIALKENWPIPASWQIDNKEELMSRLGEICYPCILKPRVKNSNFRKSNLKKAFVANNEQDLLEYYGMVSEWEQEVVVQEWIEGGDDRIAFCLTYFNSHGEPLVYFAGRKLRQWPIKCGNTAIAEPAPKEWTDNIILLSDTIFRKVGFKGLGSIEYKMRLENNNPVIMEPTVGRTNYQSEVAVINGVNIPAIAYYDLTDKKYDVKKIYPGKSVKLIDGSSERKAALAYWRMRELTLCRWIRDRGGKKKYILFRFNDPGPFIVSIVLKSWNFIKRFISYILK